MQTLVGVSLRECIEMHRNNTYPYGRTLTVGAALTSPQLSCRPQTLSSSGSPGPMTQSGYA